MLGFFSRSTKTSEQAAEVKLKSGTEAGPTASPEAVVADASSPQTNTPAPPAATSEPVGNSSAEQNADPKADARKPRKRLSLRTILPGSRPARSRSLGPVEERRKPNSASGSSALRTRSQERAHQSALVVRSLIAGPTSTSRAPTAAKGAPHLKLDKVKAELMQDKSANKLIAQLRTLPSFGDLAEEARPSARAEGPIHAVSLACPDEEADRRHFAQLVNAMPVPPAPSAGMPVNRARSVNLEARIASVATASVTQVSTLLSQIDVISLVTTTSFSLGIGEPGDGAGLLSGAVPTAKTVINGVEQVTPQLMALGYATGQAILPDHSAIYPPTDRMSVITYWWGFELVLPPPSIEFLGHAPSVAHAVMNFLTALSVVDGGVREILPFIRYISQYVDDEFNHIKDQDQGKGVVCAATWLIPVALVPRPWDFPDPSTKPPAADPSTTDGSAPSGDLPAPADPDAGPIAPGSPVLTPPPVDADAPPAVVPPADDVSAPIAATNAGPAVTVTPPTPPAENTLSPVMPVAA